jgi:hypothetical protein
MNSKNNAEFSALLVNFAETPQGIDIICRLFLERVDFRERVLIFYNMCTKHNRLQYSNGYGSHCATCVCFNMRELQYQNLFSRPMQVEAGRAGPGAAGTSVIQRHPPAYEYPPKRSDGSSSRRAAQQPARVLVSHQAPRNEDEGGAHSSQAAEAGNAVAIADYVVAAEPEANPQGRPPVYKYYDDGEILIQYDV